MPYESVSDVPSYVPKGKREQWLAIFNRVHGETSGDKKTKDTAAFRAAGVVFKAIDHMVQVFPGANQPGWVGFDLDGTLANTNSAEEIGDPIVPMVSWLKELLAGGVPCRIVTARVSSIWPQEFIDFQCLAISAWLIEHVGCDLTVQAEKDPNMIMLYDDRAIQVIPNSGACTDIRVVGLNFSLPSDHQPILRVPRGGSMCANCKFVSSDLLRCSNVYFIAKNKGPRLPYDAYEMCTDWYLPKPGLVQIETAQEGG